MSKEPVDAGALHSSDESDSDSFSTNASSAPVSKAGLSCATVSTASSATASIASSATVSTDSSATVSTASSASGPSVSGSGGYQCKKKKCPNYERIYQFKSQWERHERSVWYLVSCAYITYKHINAF